MAEWLKATDCKSVLSRVRRFESFSAHLECEKCGEFENVKIKCCITFIVLCRWNMNFHSYSFSYFHIITSGSSSFGRAVAFQASGGRFEPGLPLFFKFAVEQLYAMEAANWATSRCSSVVEHPDGNREGHKGSLPFNGSISRCSSVVEHFLGKEEVKGSIPFNGSKGEW